MKFTVALVFCILGIYGVAGGQLQLPSELVDLIKNLSQTCKGETGIADDLIEEFKKGKLPDDPKAKCYLKCMMMQLNAMQDDGHLDIELIEGSMPDVLKSHGGMETVHKCKHIHNPDFCETAFQLITCFKNENPGLAAMFE